MPVNDANAALLAPLAGIVREAGKLALQSFKSTSLKTWTKGGSSPVSEADIAVDAFLRPRLSQLVPGAAWLSEEVEDDGARRDAPSVWIVDPIDGTRAYIAGMTDWAVSVALVKDGRPLLAALYAPAQEQMFTAAAGHGAALHGSPMSVSTGNGLDGARIAGPKRFLDWVVGKVPQAVAVPKIHSLALRLARVAQGEIDAAFTAGHSHDWDLAAADLMVHEAGGWLTDLHGKTLVYNGANPVHGTLIAAGKTRHPALVELARERETVR